MDETIETPPPPDSHRTEDAATLALDPSAVEANRDLARKDYPEIDGYTIAGIVGKGGMGIVYKAHQVKLNRTVALKVLPSVVGAASSAMVSRFRREALAAARLHHTNIIPVYDYGEVADGYYYAMELVEGSPLDDVIDQMSGVDVTSVNAQGLARLITEFLMEPQVEEGDSDGHSSDVMQSAATPSAATVSATVPSALAASATASSSMTQASMSRATLARARMGRSRAYYEQVAKWMADVAEALEYAHEQGIVHRDIKPANLILSNDGRLMVADFGLAKDMDEVGVTVTGSIVGTARYISPEQASGGKLELDHRTDIYSLGATMYELLCFEPAFPGTDHRQLLAEVMTREPRSTRSILPIVPAELDTICLKAMEKSSASRYASAQALADDLRRYLNDIPIEARRPSLAKRAFKFVKRHRVVITIMLAVVAAISFGVHDLYQRRQKRIAQSHRYAESGLSLANFGEWEEAEREFEQALVLYPGSIEARLNLAWMYIKQSTEVDAETARTLLEKCSVLCEWVLARKPETVSALNFYGVCLKRLGKYAEAAEQFQKVLEHEEFYAALSNLGACYAILGNTDQAALYLRKAATAKGLSKKNVWAAAAWRNLAAFELHRRNTKAKDYIEKSLACDRASPLSLILRARILMQLREYRDDEQALNDTVTADGIAVDAKERIRAVVKRIRAQAHLQVKDYDNTLRYAREAIDLGDDKTINLMLIAIAQAKTGETDQAQLSLDDAMKNWPKPLSRRGAFVVTATSDWLWYDTARELYALRRQAESAIAGNPLVP
ncbi:MAG: protein kinase domain-containing protein [Planctomycetota bacterium]|jgi:serine/threonine protein kinase